MDAMPPAGLIDSDMSEQVRVARERAGLARAEADVAAGRVVAEAEVDAWIDSMGTPHELPVPQSGR